MITFSQDGTFTLSNVVRQEGEQVMEGSYHQPDDTSVECRVTVIWVRGMRYGTDALTGDHFLKGKIKGNKLSLTDDFGGSMDFEKVN